MRHWTVAFQKRKSLVGNVAQSMFIRVKLNSALFVGIGYINICLHKKKIYRRMIILQITTIHLLFVVQNVIRLRLRLKSKVLAWAKQ